MNGLVFFIMNNPKDYNVLDAMYDVLSLLCSPTSDFPFLRLVSRIVVHLFLHKYTVIMESLSFSRKIFHSLEMSCPRYISDGFYEKWWACEVYVLCPSMSIYLLGLMSLIHETFNQKVNDLIASIQEWDRKEGIRAKTLFLWTFITGRGRYYCTFIKRIWESCSVCSRGQESTKGVMKNVSRMKKRGCREHTGLWASWLWPSLFEEKLSRGKTTAKYSSLEYTRSDGYVVTLDFTETLNCEKRVISGKEETRDD